MALFFDVVGPVIHGDVAARAGDVLVVREGAPVPLAVMRRAGRAWRLVRQGTPDADALRRWCVDGVIRPRPRDAATVSRAS